MEKRHLVEVLRRSWSLKTSSKWTAEIPAKGQCGVTSLVVNDLLGGEIYKTRLYEGWHFYNVIDHIRHDFTASQFGGAIQYDDIPSNRGEAFQDTDMDQYNELKCKVLKHLGEIEH
ncbi:hypothetical protein JI667_12515 [Bacillus sp. NTK074B]|uniref:YunG family protein n=1 Tax=Bacillus sp. NTK074B TaxID=2802174 RepID=UPI001A8FD809|nr:hypothetical protein [Bacillus sp. NTK074B]